MAITVSNAFVTMFGDEITHASQTKASKIQNAVRTVRGVIGSTYKFPVLGKSGVVKNKVAHQDIEAMSAIDASNPAGSATYVGATTDTASISNVSASIDTYSTAEYVDDFDSLKTNVDLRSAYAESIAAAMNRAYDNAIITALDTSVTDLTLASETTGDTLNKAKLLELGKAFNDNGVPENDRFILASPEAYNDILGASDLVGNADGPLSQSIVTGMIPNVLGFNIIMSTGLSAGSASDKKCYAFHKDAVGMAVGKDITTMVNYVPQKLATLIAAEFSAGSIVIDPLAVAKFEA